MLIHYWIKSTDQEIMKIHKQRKNMKTQILIITILLFLVSCEKDEPEVEPNPIICYIQNYDFNIVKYSTGIDTVDIIPDLPLNFDQDEGYLVDSMDIFNWTIEDDTVFISGNFFNYLPHHELPMNNFIRFLYHESNSHRAIRYDTILHNAGGIDYIYYLISQ